MRPGILKEVDTITAGESYQRLATCQTCGRAAPKAFVLQSEMELEAYVHEHNARVRRGSIQDISLAVAPLGVMMWVSCWVLNFSGVWVELNFKPDLSSLLTRLSSTQHRMLPVPASGISLLLARTTSDHLSPPLCWTLREQENQQTPVPGEVS